MGADADNLDTSRLGSIRERLGRQLPNDWKLMTLGEAFRWGSGGTPKRTDSRFYGGGIPWLVIGDLNDGAVSVSATTITEAGLNQSSAKWVEPGSVLLAMYGSIGKLGIATRRLTTNQAIAFTKPDPIDAKYLFYYLMHVRSDLASLGRGATQKNISQTVIKAFPFVLAPPGQQKRIVAEIERQFSRLDEAVANLNHVKANFKRYKAAVLNAAVKGRLVETESELARREGRTYETGEQLRQRILDKRRSDWKGKGKYKGPVATDATNLPRLPEGWTWATPDEISSSDEGSIGAGPFGTIFKARDFRPAGVPIIFLRHVAPGRYLTQKPGFMDAAKWEALFQPYSVFGGELLIAKLGDPPGACTLYPKSIGPAMVTPDVIKMTVNSAAASSTFLMHYFNSQMARDFATGAAFGTTRLRLTLPIFRGMPIPYPPLCEQTRIAVETERRLSVLEELEANLAANRQKASKVRDAILKEAYCGNLLAHA